MYVKDKKEKASQNPKLLNYWTKETIIEKVTINKDDNNKSYNKMNTFNNLSSNKKFN